MPQANSTFSMPRATSPLASSSTLPCSRVTAAASSSRLASSSSRSRKSRLARRVREEEPHSWTRRPPGRRPRHPLLPARPERPRPSAPLWPGRRPAPSDRIRRPSLPASSARCARLEFGLRRVKERADIRGSYGGLGSGVTSPPPRRSGCQPMRRCNSATVVPQASPLGSIMSLWPTPSQSEGLERCLHVPSLGCGPIWLHRRRHDVVRRAVHEPLGYCPIGRLVHR